MPLCTDIINVNGNIECNTAYEFYMCEFIACNNCNILCIGDYGSYGSAASTTVNNNSIQVVTQPIYQPKVCSVYIASQLEKNNTTISRTECVNAPTGQ